MKRYRVYESNFKGHTVALSDGDGAFHVAVAVDAVPRVGARLDGPPAGVGRAVLQCADTGRHYALDFDSVGCNRQDTIERLHPQLTRGDALPPGG